MGNIIEEWKKRLNQLNTRIFKIYIGFVAWPFLAFVVTFLYILNWSQISNDYKPEVILPQETNRENSILDAKYAYYLDASPSMEGFAAIENGKLASLADIIQQISDKQSGTNFFYVCTNEIIEPTVDAFYEGMTNPQQIRSWYHNNNALTEDVSSINLTHIFHNENFNTDNNQLNIIITDGNFFIEEVRNEQNENEQTGDEQGENEQEQNQPTENVQLENNQNVSQQHDEHMNHFASQLALMATKSNICIYNIASAYRGSGVDNFWSSSDNMVNTSNSSFFIIVFSENEILFEQYVSKMDQLLQEAEIKFDRLEIVNNLLQDQHSLIVSESAFYDENVVSKNNFNYNNYYIKHRQDNEIGLYAIEGNGNIASFQGNVATLNISAFEQIEQDYINNSNITIKTKISYPYLLGLREYTQEGLVRSVNAQITKYANSIYLNLGIECDRNKEIPKFFIDINKDYYIVELQFYMEKPDYIVPQWAVNLDTEETSPNCEKKRGLVSMLETLLTVKEDYFAENADDYERYMGTLVLYISY